MLGGYSPVFYLNDDVTMRSIMSGAYTGTPDAHAVYMKYPLTYLLSLCYRLTDVVPWLEIFFYACTALCGWTILYGIKAKKWNEKLMLIMLAVFTCVPLCFYIHYTINPIFCLTKNVDCISYSQRLLLLIIPTM